MIIIGAQRKDVGISRSTELPLAADQSAQGRSRRGGRTTAEMTAIRLSLRIPATARTPMNRDRALDPKGLARAPDYRLGEYIREYRQAALAYDSGATHGPVAHVDAPAAITPATKMLIAAFTSRSSTSPQARHR